MPSSYRTRFCVSTKHEYQLFYPICVSAHGSGGIPLFCSMFVVCHRPNKIWKLVVACFMGINRSAITIALSAVSSSSSSSLDYHYYYNAMHISPILFHFVQPAHNVSLSTTQPSTAHTHKHVRPSRLNRIIRFCCICACMKCASGDKSATTWSCEKLFKGVFCFRLINGSYFISWKCSVMNFLFPPSPPQ